MFRGLSVPAHGATAALIGLVPATFLFRRLTARPDPGPRAPRSLVACVAAFGAMAVVAGTWAIQHERPGFGDEPSSGAMVAGGAAVTIVLLILLLFPRES